jgi:hypothetical protein
VLVTNDNGIVSVQLTLEQMDTVYRVRNRWCKEWLQNDVLRERYLKRRKRFGTTMTDEQLLDEHYNDKMPGAIMTEMATAQYFGAPWLMRITPNQTNPTDVDGIEVRAVDSLHKCLLTNPYDKQAPYVLGVYDIGTATVLLRGWLHLRHCNVPAHARNGIFLTPATLLHPMATLRDEYHQRKRR